MPECRCPNCKTRFRALSSEFGQIYRCASCNFEFKLNTDNLARYKLPGLIRIQLRNNDGTAFKKFPVPVIVQYGFYLPPLLSDESGQILITQETFRKAQKDEISTGIMDHRGDYSLIRYIVIKIPSQNVALTLSEQRAHSGWPLLSFEQQLYGDLPSLLDAYISKEDLKSFSVELDLSEEKDAVDLDLIVTQPGE